MKLTEAIAMFRQFSPTDDEADDVGMLYALIAQLGKLRHAVEVRQEMIRIFERHPDALLGSPGPIVHALEESSIDDHVDLLAESLVRQPTTMTVWMAERCFRSDLSDRNQQALSAALRSAADKPMCEELASSIQEALEEYGT